MDKFFIPKWKEMRRLKKLDNELPDTLAEYIQRIYRKNYCASMIFNNQQALLKEVYIPLKLIPTVEASQEDGANWENWSIEEGSLEGYLHQKIAIVDGAGMGKTTALQFLLLDTIERGIGVPVFIELRTVCPNQSIIEKILEDINDPFKQIWDAEILTEFIKRGDFIFFFDGYDEIKETEKQKISKNIIDFMAYFETNNTFLLTSRSAKDVGLFKAFRQYKVMPLEKEEAVALIKNYSKIVNVEIDHQLADVLEDSDLYEEASAFLKNPMLLALLFNAWREEKSYVGMVTACYQQFFDVLYEKQDLLKDGGFRREKLSRLPKDTFHKVVRYLAFESYFSNGTGALLNESELLKIIDNYKVIKGDEKLFDTADFVEDILVAVPILRKQGSEYMWLTEILQEFFAAYYISWDLEGNAQEAFLNQLAESKGIQGHYQIFKFCYHLNKSEVEATIFHPVFSQYIKCYDHVQRQLGNIWECEFLATELCRCGNEQYGIKFIPDSKLANRYVELEYDKAVYIGHLRVDDLKVGEVHEGIAVFICLKPCNQKFQTVYRFIRERSFSLYRQREMDWSSQFTEAEQEYIIQCVNDGKAISISEAIKDQKLDSIQLYYKVLRNVGYPTSEWDFHLAKESIRLLDVKRVQ